MTLRLHIEYRPTPTGPVVIRYVIGALSPKLDVFSVTHSEELRQEESSEANSLGLQIETTFGFEPHADQKQERRFAILGGIYILNVSQRRVTLRVEMLRIDYPDGRDPFLFVSPGGVDLFGVQTSLGPLEHTHGLFKQELLTLEDIQLNTRKSLVVRDMESDKQVIVPMPGWFPPAK